VVDDHKDAKNKATIQGPSAQAAGDARALVLIYVKPSGGMGKHNF